MRAKSFIVLLLMIFAYTKANAWNVYVKSFNSYQMEYSSLEDISINGVAEKLGYKPNFFYTYMNYDDNAQQDIVCVLFKVFTDEIIGIITEDNVKDMYQRDIDSFLKDYVFDDAFDTYNIESCLDQGIKEKNFTMNFIADAMKIDCDTTQINGMIVSEKFKYNLYFLNGILIKYETSDGYGKWVKNMRKRDSDYFNKIVAYATKYWKDDKEGIINEVNAQCDAQANCLGGFTNEHLEAFYENGVYNFKMLNVLYAHDKVNLREFKDFNHGNVTFIREKNVIQNGENVKVYIYKTRNGIFTFDEFGFLRGCQPL